MFSMSDIITATLKNKIPKIKMFRRPLIRMFHTSSCQRHLTRPEPGKGLKVTYITPKNDLETVHANEGENLLEIAHFNDIELEGNLTNKNCKRQLLSLNLKLKTHRSNIYIQFF